MFKGKTRKDYPHFFIDNRIICKESEIHRLGVFATESISSRTLIEASPVIKFHVDTYKLLSGGNKPGDPDQYAVRPGSYTRHVLMDYPFGWDTHTNVIALGYGGLYNHSTLAANVKWKPCDEGIDSLDFYTTRDIEPGEELLIRYLPNSMIDNLWFVDEEVLPMYSRQEPGIGSFRDLSFDIKNLK